ncbi:MAG: GTP cyclohydrolase [Alphaproteobacteria bacterium]|jgi:uncharacterized protein YciI|nr:GTP cyclohydrolase [Alphaproteobacteria bacterium]
MKSKDTKPNLFLVILSYKVDLEKINSFRADHLEFLQNCYDKNLFIISGPKVPRNGGVILARCDSKDMLLAVLEKDPFAINDLADYEVIEFEPTKWSSLFERVLFS